MKFIACADLHLSDKCPKNRKGDYFKQILIKFEYILKFTQKTNSKLLIVAGDFFDATKVKYKVTNNILAILQKYTDIKILVIPGQHDLNYHVAGLDNTPLGVLETANVVTILNPKDTIVIDGISFLGCGWNEIPKNKADVLIMHLMVTKKDSLWPGQTNYSTAHSILRKYPWARCIITGDNHAPHVLKTKSGKLQVNCGSLVRSTKAQIGFKPRIYLIDTFQWKAKPIKIPCLLDEDVFDFNQIDIDEIKKEAKEKAELKIAKFISTLPKNAKEKPNFKKILNEVIKQTNPKQSVRNIINNTMENLI